jgi:hypothetical protein
MLAAVTLLAGAIAGGLLRAGVPLPADGAWPGHAVTAHAFLMICGFLATVIGLERAVAAKARLAFAAPVTSALAGAAALGGAPQFAAWAAVLAAFAFVMVNVAMWQRQRAPHIALLGIGALALLIGSLLHALGGARGSAAVPWWFAFLVLTIAAERLEMTRLMRRRRGANEALVAVLGVLLLGAAAFSISPVIGAALYGAALLALALWLAVFDIARRTLAATGLSRYMALCLLSGYAWLAVAGAAWIATALGAPLRDLALHALGLGFVFAMMLAHAPVILPALTRVKLLFGPHFYVALTLLHASLALRAFAALDFQALSAGALGNALAIALFLVTMLASAAAWRFKHPPREPHASAARHR